MRRVYQTVELPTKIAVEIQEISSFKQPHVLVERLVTFHVPTEKLVFELFYWYHEQLEEPVISQTVTETFCRDLMSDC